ncbi:hypothetical protein HD597_004109 [Nonomuraea thailandensis]|uniref:Uncharacterized protein n=1 Tax=Nonomuraea thailandensis TaxID=1188745 RepID=A0A9X2GDF9_9ACTN|nr:hypothetical protein [Nonomuraea thailandensis]MCP2357089.1 hypothetical protein [Nonomuraea thailandensis]
MSPPDAPGRGACAAGRGGQDALVHNCPSGFTSDTVVTAFDRMRNEGGPAMRHLIDDGLILNEGSVAAERQARTTAGHLGRGADGREHEEAGPAEGETAERE